jgi:hypothetical protein
MSATKSQTPRPSAEELRQLYVDQGLGCPEIGRMLGRDASTVRLWLVAAGIPTRARGSDSRQHFKPGLRSAFAGRKHHPDSIAKITASTVADGRVPYLRNGAHWLTGAAPEDNPNWQGGRTPERQEFYRTPEWRAACQTVWARDSACCRNCGKAWKLARQAGEQTFHVHHVWSFQIRETRANPALLVLLCRPCHLWVHSNANTTRAWLPQEPDATTFPGLDELHAMPAMFAALEAEAA